MDTLRVLVVGSSGHLDVVTAALMQAGHDVIPVDGLADASEALLIQRFDAVLLGDLPAAQIQEFARTLKDVDRRSGTSGRTAILSTVPSVQIPGLPTSVGVDGYLPESSDPDTLTLAIWRLASAVGTETVQVQEAEEAEVLPVLDVEQLKEQVAYDDELLVELIDLFLSERTRQVQEMKESFEAEDFEHLSRTAHTIKGSLGSLHALAAKANAQALELAAKAHQSAASGKFLAALEADLNVLEGHLVKVRRSVSPS